MASRPRPTDNNLVGFFMRAGFLFFGFHRSVFRPGRRESAMALIESILRRAHFTSPLVGEVGSHRRCDPGEGLRSIDGPEPLTPTSRASFARLGLPQGGGERTSVAVAVQPNLISLYRPRFKPRCRVVNRR